MNAGLIALGDGYDAYLSGIWGLYIMPLKPYICECVYLPVNVSLTNNKHTKTPKTSGLQRFDIGDTQVENEQSPRHLAIRLPFRVSSFNPERRAFERSESMLTPGRRAKGYRPGGRGGANS